MKKKLTNISIIVLIVTFSTVLMQVWFGVTIKVMFLTVMINSIIATLAFLLINNLIKKPSNLIPTLGSAIGVLTVGIMLFLIWFIPAYMLKVDLPYLETSILCIIGALICIIYVVILYIIVAIIEKVKKK